VGIVFENASGAAVNIEYTYRDLNFVISVEIVSIALFCFLLSLLIVNKGCCDEASN